jgi:predicted ATPase
MLRKVSVRNYKSIGDVDVTLERFTVLIGPNGSGKSNFVDALRFMREAIVSGLDTAISHRRGIRAIRRWSPRRPVDVAIRLEFIFPDGTQTIYGLELGSERGGEYCIKRELCQTIQSNGTEDGFEVQEGRIVRFPKVVKGVLELLPAPPEPQRVQVLLFPFLGMAVAQQAWNFLRSIGFYHPLPNAIRTSAYMPVIVPPPLLEHGENLPFVLKTLHQHHPDTFQQISKYLRQIVPGLKSLAPSKSGDMLEVEHGDENETLAELEFWQESDGTLRLLALLTAMYQQPPLAMLVIEEPELTVHPEALAVLVDLLIERSAYQQVLITTHSPDLLNRLPAETLRIVELEEGTTKIGPLSEEQKAVIEAKYFKMGDLLRLEGLRRELPEPIQPPVPLKER